MERSCICTGYEEFKKAMKEMKFDEGELQALFRFFDRDCNGYISYDEFITGLRGQLNQRRRELVFMAYKVIALLFYQHRTLRYCLIPYLECLALVDYFPVREVNCCCLFIAQ